MKNRIKNFIWKVVPSDHLFIAWGTTCDQNSISIKLPWWIMRLSNHIEDREFPQEYLTLFPKRDLNLYFQTVMRIDELEKELFL